MKYLKFPGSRFSAVFFCSLSVGWLSTPADASVFFDDFTDGDRVDGVDPNDIQWFAGRNNVALSVVEDPGIGGGNALFVNSSTTFSRSVGLMPSGVTIEAGETLELSFDLRFATDPSAGGNLLRVGIYHNGGTALSGDGAGTQTDDFGYGMYTNPAAASTTGTRVATETAGNSILGGASPSGLSGTGASGASVNWGTTPHSVQFSITRLEDGSLGISSSIDGGAPATANIGSPIAGNYTFHQIAVGQGNMNRDVYLDNVELQLISDTVVTPKITSFSPLGGGVWEVIFSGDPDGSYEFVSSTTLDFTTDDVVTLVQADPLTDPGTVDGGGNFVTTDSGGMARVRMTLGSDPIGFIRAQTLP